MFCRKCGKETINENGVCDACNQEVEIDEISNDTPVSDLIEKGKGVAALIWSIVGLLTINPIFILIALILAGKSKHTQTAKQAKIAKIIAIISIVIIIFVLLILSVALIIILAGSSLINDYGKTR